MQLERGDRPLRFLPESAEQRTRLELSPEACCCRVGPGNFTPSPSQIRTGYSRIIRLVPSHEGCRLPLNKGLLPANQLAHISGDDPPPSLQPHYRTFVATTRQSVPLRRIGTFGLAEVRGDALPLADRGAEGPARRSGGPLHAEPQGAQASPTSRQAHPSPHALRQSRGRSQGLVSHSYVDSEAAAKLTTGAFNALRTHPKIGRAEALRRSNGV